LKKEVSEGETKLREHVINFLRPTDYPVERPCKVAFVHFWQSPQKRTKKRLSRKLTPFKQYGTATRSSSWQQ